MKFQKNEKKMKKIILKYFQPNVRWINGLRGLCAAQHAEKEFECDRGPIRIRSGPKWTIAINEWSTNNFAKQFWRNAKTANLSTKNAWQSLGALGPNAVGPAVKGFEPGRGKYFLPSLFLNIELISLWYVVANVFYS